MNVSLAVFPETRPISVGQNMFMSCADPTKENRMNPTIATLIDTAQMWAGQFLNKLEASMTLLGYEAHWLHILWLTIGVGMLVVAYALEVYSRLGVRAARATLNWLRARYADRHQPEAIETPELKPRVIVIAVPHHGHPNEIAHLPLADMPTLPGDEYVH